MFKYQTINHEILPPLSSGSSASYSGQYCSLMYESELYPKSLIKVLGLSFKFVLPFLFHLKKILFLFFLQVFLYFTVNLPVNVHSSPASSILRL